MDDPKPDSMSRERSLLREFLTDHDVTCPQCQYNLRNLTGNRCPECGEQLALGVHLVEPKLAAPITGLVGLAAGAGLNGLLILYWAIVLIFYRPGRSWMDKFVYCNVIEFVVVGGALSAWIWKWRGIRAAPASARWGLVALCWILSVADLVVFTIVIR